MRSMVHVRYFHIPGRLACSVSIFCIRFKQKIPLSRIPYAAERPYQTLSRFFFTFLYTTIGDRHRTIMNPFVTCDL